MQASEKTPQKRSGFRRFIGHPVTQFAIAIAVVALIQAFLVKIYYVPSGSMEQTLHGGPGVNDRLLVNRTAYWFQDPKPGDVIVFNASELWEDPASRAPQNPVQAAIGWIGGIIGIGPTNDHTLIKRLIAGPGQTISCCDAAGNVMVDGKPLNEPYIYENQPFTPGVLDCSTSPISMRCFGEYKVPEGSYVVMGDHRSVSADSVINCRGTTEHIDGCLKLVGRRDVVGYAFQIVFPFDRWGPIASINPQTS